MSPAEIILIVSLLLLLRPSKARPSKIEFTTDELITGLRAPLAGMVSDCLGDDLVIETNGGKKSYSANYSDDRYNKDCSFVVSSDKGVNCSSIYTNYIKNLNCTYIAKLNVDRTWLETIQFDKVEFCWGKVTGSTNDIITAKYDWWYLKNIEKCNYHIETESANWITIREPHNVNRYLMLPIHANKISVMSKRIGSMMAVLNTSPWYIVQMLKLPHDPTSKTVWTIPFKTGRNPFVVTRTDHGQVPYIHHFTPLNCTRVYSPFYTFCIEAYNTSAVTDIEMLPKKYKIEDANYDLFHIYHYSTPDNSHHITGFFDKIFNHTANEISEIFKKFSNISFDPKDLFLNHVLIPTEHYILSLFGRLFKFILSSISAWFNFVAEEYLGIFVLIDCDYMLFEILILVFVFFYYFPAYIATGVFTSILVMLIGVKRTYITFSPINLAVTTVNHFTGKRYFHYCNETDCYYLYDLKCTNNS